MILDVKTRELTNGYYFKKTYRLTKKQMKLLMLLSDNYLHSTKEIIKYMKWKDKNNLYRLIISLRKRVKDLDLINSKTLGYKLEDEIKLTY